MQPEYTSDPYIDNHLFELGHVLCKKHITMPNPDDCFIVTSPYFCGSECNFYFHVRQLLGKRHKSLTDITELDYKNVTDYMYHHYPELFIQDYLCTKFTNI